MDRLRSFSSGGFLGGRRTLSSLAVSILSAPHRVLPPEEPAVIRILVVVDLPDTDILRKGGFQVLGPRAQLSARVGSLKVVEAFVSDEGIEGRVSLKGDSHLRVNWE